MLRQDLHRVPRHQKREQRNQQNKRIFDTNKTSNKKPCEHNQKHGSHYHHTTPTSTARTNPHVTTDDGKPDFGNIQAFAYTFVKDAYDNIWNLEATYQQEYLAYDIVIDRNMDGEDLPTTSTEIALVLRNVNDMAIGFLGDLRYHHQGV